MEDFWIGQWVIDTTTDESVEIADIIEGQRSNFYIIERYDDETEITSYYIQHASNLKDYYPNRNNI